MTISILRLPEVIKTTGLGRSTIYRDINLGSFPKPIKLGEKSTGWLSSDISTWIESRIKERDDKAS
ncbi:AlpA family transcriptional regulator [Cycloclasticus pugetii]|uniref:helix-turn-helix transcriptional regulator n=1 Tax=Cycloclasticus pugetii TaxID=34068 RepID=UPI0030C6CF87